jgi:hypothetical protein
MGTKYLMPPRLTDSAGRPRRAGFEFELGNLPVIEAAHALQEALGGDLTINNPFQALLSGTALGVLKIERDARLLSSGHYRKWLQQLGLEFEPGSIGHEIEANIDNASSLLIPCEVITEPIGFDRLDRLDDLSATLKAVGAQGTQDSFIFAFGLHINPSLPAGDVGTLLRFLQAFLLLHNWIIETAGIDITRRFFTKFIDPFPQEYMDLVLRDGYRPDLERFIGDYLHDNPTRNRALDLLPVLMELRPELVTGALMGEERFLVKGRPAFHYRLPDCKVNLPGWCVADAWNQWVYIEKLAADEALLRELTGEWRECNDRFSLAPKTTWTMHLTSILSRKFFES